MSRPLITIIARRHITTMSSTTTIIHQLPYLQEVSGVLQSFIVLGQAGTTIVVLLHSYIQVRVNHIQKSSCFLRVINLLLNRSYTLENENENRGLGKVQMNHTIIHRRLCTSTAIVNVSANVII
jgi:hypothetical protein